MSRNSSKPTLKVTTTAAGPPLKLRIKLGSASPATPKAKAADVKKEEKEEESKTEDSEQTEEFESEDTKSITSEVDEVYYENYRKLERMTARQRAMVGNETALEFEGGLDVLNQKPKKELTEEEIMKKAELEFEGGLDVLNQKPKKEL